MAMGITHNISAINTQRNLNITNRQLSKSLEKLSSGYRINVGADGPADLVISEQLRAQNAGLERAVRNTQEAMNVLGIAEGALNEMNEILKKMRALALHASNNGITSPSQIAADQAEMDSGIQTIDRIAATTKYSDQFLLNGAKGILFDRSTEKGNAMLDLSYTRIDQVFKRQGTVETLSFAGSVDTDDAANMAVQATKGFVESGATSASRFEINSDTNEIKADQRFIITGSKGSREFSFSEGTDLSAIATAISNVKDSTGVDASVVMLGSGITNRTANVDNATGVSGSGSADVSANANIVSAGQTLIFGEASGTNRVDGVTWSTDPILGKGTDGQGRVYVDFGGTFGAGNTATVRLYKADKNPLTGEYNAEDLVAEGTATLTAASTTMTFSERNESGVNGQFEMTMAGALPSDVVLVTQTVDRTEAARQARLDLGGSIGDWGFNVVADAVSGATGAEGNNISVELIDAGVKGATTSATLEQVDANDITKGLKIKVTLGTSSTTGEINATVNDVIGAINGSAGTYVTATASSAAPATDIVQARAETYLSGGTDADTTFQVDGTLNTADTIAVSGAEIGVNTDKDGKLYFEVTDADGDGLQTSINVYKDASKSADSLVASWTGAEPAAAASTFLLDQENDSGLRIAIQVAAGDLAAGGTFANGDSTLTFETGLRLSSTEYGSSEFVRVEALQGNMWDVHDAGHADADGRGYVNLDTSEGFVTMESRGSGAVLAVNGQEIFTDGLTAEAATPDFNGHLVFREGDLGQTTIAQVGYTRAVSTAAIGQMTIATNMAVNAGVDAREDLYNFSNGMQFQLGEGQGDQERTVYGIQSMSVANLGKVKFTDDFGSGEQTTKTLTLSDVLGGGFASLAVDPVKALTVIDKAIDDVTGLRARLGAAQSNLLQTNANSLSVAIENITKTESAIRDADMAAESTDFTKNQILVQAGVGMLAQANVAAQSVMQLLG